MEKKIYPDYHLQYSNLGIFIMTYVRKQNSSGVWYLIPVVKRWYFNTNEKIDIQEDLLKCLKEFHRDCYMVTLFYLVQDIPPITLHGTPTEILDDNQKSEKDRLIYKPINKIEEHE